MSKQDSAFYTTNDSWELVWSEDNGATSRGYYVVVNGEMKLDARKSLDEGWTSIRTAWDLENYGITTDKQLQELEQRGSDYCVWHNNSWFEVWSDRMDFHEEWDVFHTLDEAIAEAKALNEKENTSGQ